MPDDAKKGSMLAQIVSAVVIALLVGGSAPWWAKSHKDESKPEPAPAPQVIVNTGPVAQPIPGQITPLPSPVAPPIRIAAAEPSLTASRDFFVGRWRVDQEQNGISSQANIDYFSNGRFEGTQSMVNAYQGRRANVTGNWTYEQLSNNLFRVTFAPDVGYTTSGKFKIVDHNHIQNIDQNYVAERIE